MIMAIARYIVVGFCLLIATAPAFAEDWVTFKLPKDNVTVSLPSQPHSKMFNSRCPGFEVSEEQFHFQITEGKRMPDANFLNKAADRLETEIQHTPQSVEKVAVERYRAEGRGWHGIQLRAHRINSTQADVLFLLAVDESSSKMYMLTCTSANSSNVQRVMSSLTIGTEPLTQYPAQEVASVIPTHGRPLTEDERVAERSRVQQAEMLQTADWLGGSVARLGMTLFVILYGIRRIKRWMNCG